MTSTIGVSIPVPDPWGSQIQQARTGYGDPQGPCVPTHITLLPPTEVTDADLAGLRAHLAQVARRVEPFQVLLSGTGTFMPVSPVVFIQVSQGVSVCEQLEEMIRRGPVGLPRTFPYHPHVTVAHDVPDEARERAFAEMRGLEARFEVDALVLYRNEGGAWSPTEEFALTGTRT